MTAPSYDRTRLVPSVVHLSVGCFHRAHQAVYFDDLAQGGHTGWGIVGVGLRSPQMHAVMLAQDGLYTVVERGAERDRARIVGSIRRYFFAPNDQEAVLAALADPRTRVVTMTITGGAYHLDPVTGAFESGHAAIAADLAAPERPCSALGFLVEGLRRRRDAGLPPFTVLSCDNILNNGPLARTAVVSLARMRDERLAHWIDTEGAFPSSMVDRIAPQTTSDDRRLVAERFGVDDRWPVVTEPFSQWIIEDDFCNGRPPLHLAGAQFVSDVRPYALMKTRLLNGSHCALGYLGSLAGLERIDQAMGDAVFREYIGRLMTEEVSPLLPPVPGIDLPDYRATLLERFANPKLGDQLERLCRAGSAKMPRHVVASIMEAVAGGRPHRLLTLAVAGWCRYLLGSDDDGRPLVVDDPLAARLTALATAGDGIDPLPLLRERSLFGDLAEDRRFVADVRRALHALERLGTRGAIEAALTSGDPVVA